MFRRQLILSVAAGLLLVGCDRREQASVPSVPATQPAQAVAVERPIVPSATQPSTDLAEPASSPIAATSSFTVYENGRGTIYEFPRARIHIDASNNTAILYSDDPKTAINRDYAGNNFYLAVPLDKDRPLKLDGVQWDFRSDSGGEHQGSSDGFFLTGQRYHLQPADIHVELRGEGPTAAFRIIGQFVKFDADRAGASHLGYDVALQSGVLTPGRAEWIPAGVDGGK